MSDYEYDIFICYSHLKPVNQRKTNPNDEEWNKWVNKTLVSMLEQGLSGKNVVGTNRIFHDQLIHPDGAISDNAVKEKILEAHAKSRILIPLFNNIFFSRKWCCAELALMCDRQHH